MKRVAFKMSIHPGSEDEYIKRHNPIWPELEQALKNHGVSTYTIFIDRETLELFAYAEIEDEERWNAIADTDVCKKWWKHMEPLMPSNPDSSPLATSMDEIFHIEK